MNLVLFIFTILVSFIVVRIGAIAFHMTGLSWHQANFQALSCFSGTGFTTREAEMITISAQRRRIASVLMVLGNAGIVTLIATLANSIRPSELMSRFQIPFLHMVIPNNFMPLVNIMLIAIIIYVIFKIYSNKRLSGGLTKILKSKIVQKQFVSPVSFEELWTATGGYGISQIEINSDSPVLNHTLIESNLRRRDITVLAIERKGATIPNPSAEMRILVGDKLTCFGKLDKIRDQLYSEDDIEKAENENPL